VKHIRQFQDFLLESSGDELHTKRGVWIKIDPTKHPDLAEEFFELIHTAYQEMGGHLKVKSPEDVFSDPEWTYWKGIDIHRSPDVDLIIIGKNTHYGVKYVGVGHDGSREAKKVYLDEESKELKKKGFYIEASGKLASILIQRFNVPVVDDEKEVRKVIGDVEWKGKPSESTKPGDGWYVRTIGGKKSEKILLGRPKV